MASTLNIALQNRSHSNTVYAYITGLAINKNNTPFLLRADGKTQYYPTSPPTILTPLAEDCAIRLGSPGSTTTVTIPQIAGGRIWFSIDTPLTFLVNPGPALVEPSVTNPSDPNFKSNWGFCEFTFNSAQLFANISYVDFVSLPISLALTNTAGATQKVSGLNPDGLNAVCAGLAAQHARDQTGWDQLIVKDDAGQNLRALSPNQGRVLNPALFASYYDSYVDAVWAKYAAAGSSFAVDTQAAWGTLTGRIVHDQLVFGNEAFSRPSTADIFSCSTGPFAPGPSAERGALIARISAAFNRSTLLLDEPARDDAASFYADAVTNHYARVVHEANADGKGYAFPFDDVDPASGVDQSGKVNDGAPALFTVAIGGSVS